MGDNLVILRFGDTFLDVRCDVAKFPTTADNEAGIPPGYVQIESAEKRATALTPGGAELPILLEGNTALVREEHVAMIQKEG